ncbi:MAG: hypothetical protein EBS53_11180, partial [Bacteroidetes bacterium]|nr:hypothetical protein [Bacteroidota bacterium]
MLSLGRVPGLYSLKRIIQGRCSVKLKAACIETSCRSKKSLPIGRLNTPRVEGLGDNPEDGL